ncbi:hypothetical protein [Solirubrobacter soli]|uniref:hypothetical protein n=1 Tax=Solirubrobacter soli TaxID=363832 RepID=UPI0004090A46|nr:hypothetical protein [Solirubrobacter soli]
MAEMTSADAWKGSPAEAERQLTAAAERHREAVSSSQELGRPEAGQHAAIKSVGRAVQLVSFALRRAEAAGVSHDRLVELSGWESDLVREGLRRVPEPHVIARLAPTGLDPRAVGHSAAGFEVLTRLNELTQAVSAEVDGEPPSALRRPDLEALRERFDTAWASWLDTA